MTDHTVDVWKEIVSSLANKLNGELEHVDDLYVAIEELDSHVKLSANFIAEQDKTIASLLAQLEQREQEIADLTAVRTQLREMNTKQAIELAKAKHGVQWHPASEQPERWPVLVKNLEQCYHTYYHGLPCGAVRWCYIDEVK